MVTFSMVLILPQLTIWDYVQMNRQRYIINLIIGSSSNCSLRIFRKFLWFSFGVWSFQILYAIKRRIEGLLGIEGSHTLQCRMVGWFRSHQRLSEV